MVKLPLIREPNAWIAAVTRQTDTVFKALEKTKKIKNMDEFNTAAGYMKFLKTTAKLAREKQPKKEEDPFAVFFKRVNKTDKLIKAVMKEFLTANKAKVEALDADVASGKIKNVSKYVSKVAALSVDSEYASTRRTWKAHIVDESKVPRKWLTVDVAKVTEHLRQGGAPIPGISWEQETGISI